MFAPVQPDYVSDVIAVLENCKRVGLMMEANASSSLLRTRERGIDDRDVLRQLLLHLPRYGELDTVTPSRISEICEWCARDLIQLRSDPRDLLLAPVHNKVPLADTTFDRIDSEAASALIHRYHYLQSPRTDAIAYGLLCAEEAKESVVALATVSPFDLLTAVPALPDGVTQDEVAVISRVLAFPKTPPNAISFLLRNLYSELKSRSKITLLLSYINPNLGFGGASLKSSGWWRMAYELKPYYLYLDGHYVTERTCIRTYGTSRFSELQGMLEGRIARSIGKLSPLILYAFHLRKNETFRRSKNTVAIIRSPFEH
jgi:hypothetical protein